MRSVPPTSPKSQPPAAAATPVVRQLPIPLDDGTTRLALIQDLIPLGLRAVAQALTQEVTALAGARYARDDAHPDVVRWGSSPTSAAASRPRT